MTPERGAVELRFSVLGSSSSGNCTLVTDGATTLLFDAGLPINYTALNILSMTGREALDGIMVSHEHSDHTRYLFALAKKYSCPVFVSQAVLWYLSGGPSVDMRTMRDREPMTINTLTVTPFVVPHDALDPFGFIIDGAGRSLGIVTDCGSMDGPTLELLRDRDALVIESNYDADMLLNGRYPAFLKDRIGDPRGHLSNQMCGDIIRQIIGPRTRQVVLAHLSEENNDPLLALQTTLEAVGASGMDIDVQVSYPRHPTRLVSVGCLPDAQAPFDTRPH
ncbi:MAG: MBL fold metallo-hydrolase [Candidatus Thermoplasmatota archaeon]|jgi:phosphoribosyl 1,2-cyclic phosphodiesterase|nr:MBL fold metallo-hydrolase [Candidatus Thermoplasmatota archaeon]